MLSPEFKLKFLRQVSASNTFKNASTSRALLRYLVQKHIEGVPLKESIIELEFFGNNSNLENTSSRVRVNIYNLRKKLHKYYQTEGKHDPWIIKLEKGQYEISFVKRNRSLFNLKLKSVIPYLISTTLLLVLILSHLPPEKTTIWEDFFNSGRETTLIIGDAFGYTGKTISGHNGWTRDFAINSLQEYLQLTEIQPGLRQITSPSTFNYATRMAENATHALSRFFSRRNGDFSIKYATQTTSNDIKNKNIIYVGRYRHQPLFTFLFNQANPNFKIRNDSIVFQSNSLPRDSIFPPPGSFTEMEYALVSRIPGPGNSELFLFFSNHDIGVMATTDFFTNLSALKSFCSDFLNQHKYFTALFKVKGKNRVDLQLNTIKVSVIQP